MKGLNSLKLLRTRLFLDRRVEQGQWWYLPLREIARTAQRRARRRMERLAPAQAPSGGVLGPCPMPFREMVINCDGTVACGSTAAAPLIDAYDERPVARSLSSLWEGAGFQAMRARMLAGDASGCAGCTLWQAPGFAHLSNAEVQQGVAVSGFIQQLLIEPTAQCNLDCPTVCGQGYPRKRQPASRRKTRFMPLELFKRIVDGIDRPIEKICFYNYGEPLLHPDFFAMCQLIREWCPSAHIVTSTNGTRLIEPNIREGLLCSGLDELIVSLDGATQASYEAYRRGGRLDEILEGMRRLRAERDVAGLDRPTIVWRYILFAWNDSVAELARAEALAEEVGVDRFCFQLSDLSELASQVYRPGTEAFDRIRTKLY